MTSSTHDEFIDIAERKATTCDAPNDLKARETGIAANLKYLIAGTLFGIVFVIGRDHFLVSYTGNVQASFIPYVRRDRHSGRYRYAVGMDHQTVPHKNDAGRNGSLSRKEIPLG